MIIEGFRQTYGVGMPIILQFNRPVTNRAAVERALQIRTSRRVVGAWYWDDRCRLAPECLYFRPRHYWPPHTRVSFVGHLNGVEAAPGVYGHHTLTQAFRIGSSLKVVASTTSKSSVLSKRYGSTFIWAQLSGWFKQTVYDPTASLSAERRGTISLPDIESCYGTARQRYGEKVCPC